MKDMTDMAHSKDTVILEEEKAYLYWFCQIPPLGAASIRKLWNAYGSFQQLYNIEGKQFVSQGLLNQNQAQCFENSKNKLDDSRKEYESLSKRNIRFITFLDPAYPERLTHIEAAPVGLYVKGKLPNEKSPSAAIIGARNCTSYGRQMAEWFGRELGNAGVSVISGLAAGIDGAGHQGALDGYGETFGVLGCGINICYPSENYLLYQAMEKRGGLISECRLKEAPAPKNFPMRNRIISGLSDFILVMEARKKSGSLITAELGLEQGKEIFALPGRTLDPLSEGCNQLIRDGAGILGSPEEILEYIGVSAPKLLTVHEKNQNGLAKKEKMLYSCLDLQPKHLEQLAIESGLSINECLGILLELEINGFIIETASHYYVKKL